MIRNHLFYLYICLFSFSNYSISQVFSLVNSPVSKLNYAVVNDQYGFAMVGGTRQFKSIDQGQTWTQLNSSSGSPLYQFEAQNIAISSGLTMCLVGYNAVTASYIVVRTTDGGNSWSQTLSVSYSQPLKDIAANGNTLIVTGINGIYRSTDAGLNWNFLPLSSGGQSSSFVRYNTASASWIIGGYLQSYQYSGDDGLTWQNLTIGFNPDVNVLAESSTSNGVLFARKTASTTQMLLLDAANTIDTTAIVESNLVMNGNPCLTGAFFNGNLITHSQNLFYQVDPSTNNVYHFGFPASGGSYLAEEISLGITYGVAITSTSGGSGRIYRIDLTQAPAVYVPSYFNIQGPGPCAGDPIIASAIADYADSVKWYVNNILISTSNSMNYPTPLGVYTTYNVKLETYYHGVVNTTTKSVIMTAPQMPHSFAYSLDTSVCYGSPLHVFIDPSAGNPVNTAVKILYNGQLIYGPVTMTTSNINATTLPVTASGTMQIISYKTNYCDNNNSDTINQQVIVGPNLFDFTILDHDSVICSEVNPVIPITGTNPSYSYDFFPSNSWSNPGSPHVLTSGSASDTLEIELEGFDWDINISSTPDTYGNVYLYVNLSISDNAGCVSQKIIDTIRIQRRTAAFELHSRSYIESDTVNLSNAYVVPNRLWSSPELNSVYIQNETAQTPLIIADTTGFFGIKLRNEPILGCDASATHYVHYANYAPNPDSSCIVKKMHEMDKLHRTKMDQFGNIYEIRAFKLYNVLVPLYIIRKNDHAGNLIWEKRSTYLGGGYNGITGIAIEEIDFDSEGNPVVGLWIHGDEPYQDDYIQFTPSSWHQERNECYIIKIDKNTGGLIWSKNLNMIAPTAGLGLNARLTDIVVHGDFIYASTYEHANLDFYTLASDNGNLINTSPLNLTWTGSTFIPLSGLMNGGGSYYTHGSFWSPQLDVLSTGEVIAIGNYKGTSNPSQPQLETTTSTSGIFVMKYHPDYGVYDVAKLAQTGSAAYMSNTGVFNDLPKMFVDKNDNITVSAYWQYEYGNYEIQILDSILPMESGTFVVNMDKNYQMNWLSAGTHSHVEDLVYVEATNETYLACKTKHNFSMGTGEVNLMSGEAQHYSLQYTSVPNYMDYPWLNHPTKQVFITKLNGEGKPVSIKKFDCGTADENESLPWLSVRLAVSSCGDLAAFVNTDSETSVAVDGQTYQSDSVMLFLYYSNCNVDDCSYLDVDDTLKLCELSQSIDIQLFDYYNLNTLSYDVIVNGAAILINQTATVVNGHFSIPFPINAAQTQGFRLAFTSPNADTLAIVYSNLEADFGILADDHFCIYDAPIQLDNSTPSGGAYFGTGVLANQFNPSIAGIGSHYITYAYTDQYGCFTSDSISVFVDSCSYLNVDDTLLLCDKDSTVLVQINDYYDLDTVTFDIIVNDVTILINQTATVVNGHFSFPLASGVTNELKLVFTSPNTDTLVIRYSDLVVDFGILSQYDFCVYNGPFSLPNSIPLGGVYSGVGVVGNQFYPTISGVGTHLISYTYTDNDNCTKSDTVSVFVDNCAGIEDQHLKEFQAYPNPFTSELHLACSEESVSNCQLNIVDHVGRTILQQDIIHKDTVVLLSQLSKGNYTLEIMQAGRCVHREQIVKM